MWKPGERRGQQGGSQIATRRQTHTHTHHTPEQRRARIATSHGHAHTRRQAQRARKGRLGPIGGSGQSKVANACRQIVIPRKRDKDTKFDHKNIELSRITC